MSYTTFNISFYCRSSKENSKGLAPIEMCIIINGERAVITLPRKENPKQFRIAIQAKRGNEIKDYLEATRKRLNAITTEMMEQGILLTPKTLREYYMHGGVRKMTIEELFDEYLHILEKRVDIDLTPRTYRKYLLARDRLFRHVDKDKPVSAITSAVIVDYISSLRKDYNSVTTTGYAQKIKTFVKYGMSKGFLSVNPFVGIHLRKGNDMHIQYLTEEEMNRIRDTDYRNESLNRVRDLFVFQASSGLSYCDMATLVPSDFQRNDEGQLYVHKPRAKTKHFFTSVILPDGEDILEKYNYRLPIISNNKCNAYLKAIRDLAGIDKPLHTHMARHTYATRCINAGIRLEVVAKLLGQTSTRVCLHYAKLLQKNIVNEVQEAFRIVRQQDSEGE